MDPTGDSTYRIVGDITIESGVTLTIEPGVTVNFTDTDTLRILVNGTLIAVGTDVDSIIFEHETPGEHHFGIDFKNNTTASILEYCRIQDGIAPGDGSYGGWPDDQHGGGIFIENSSPIIRHCSIINNQANFGGGIFILNASSAIIEANIIQNNTASTLGGGMACNGGGLAQISSPTINNNIFTLNVCSGGGGGGGIGFAQWSTVNLLYNLFYDNHADAGGGGLRIFFSDNVILARNSIFWNNTATTGPAQIDPNDYTADLTVEYCDVEGGFTGTGNIDADPLFNDAANGDFHIEANSAVVDTGINIGAPADDFDGNTRPFDGNRDGTETVDIGPYEYINTVPQITSIPITSTLEDDLYNYQVEVLDPDAGEVITYSLSVAPDWLEITTTGLIHGTPTNDDVGDTTVTVIVSDLNVATDSQTYPLTVQNVNDAPTISDIPIQITSEDTATGNIAFTVDDVDNDPASLTLSAASTNTSLVPVDSIFFGGSGTNRTVNISPVADQNGSTTITITGSDGIYCYNYLRCI